MTPETCASCRSFDPERSWCRARPPRVLEAAADHTATGGPRVLLTVWPLVDAEIDWCSSYRFEARS